MNNMAHVETSNEYWSKYFDGTDFGTTNYAALIYEALMKVVCGYSSGATVQHILLSSGLAKSSDQRISLTAHGERTLYCFYTESLKISKVVKGNFHNRSENVPYKGRAEVLGQFSHQYDEETSTFIRAWEAYYKASEQIDGHLPPEHPDQAKLGHLAVKAGYEALYHHVPQDIVIEIIRSNDYQRYDKWRAAKLEARRRLGIK